MFCRDQIENCPRWRKPRGTALCGKSNAMHLQASRDRSEQLLLQLSLSLDPHFCLCFLLTCHGRLVRLAARPPAYPVLEVFNSFRTSLDFFLFLLFQSCLCDMHQEAWRQKERPRETDRSSSSTVWAIAKAEFWAEWGDNLQRRQFNLSRLAHGKNAADVTLAMSSCMVVECHPPGGLWEHSNILMDGALGKNSNSYIHHFLMNNILN